MTLRRRSRPSLGAIPAEEGNDGDDDDDDYDADDGFGNTSQHSTTDIGPAANHRRPTATEASTTTKAPTAPTALGNISGEEEEQDKRAEKKYRLGAV